MKSIIYSSAVIIFIISSAYAFSKEKEDIHPRRPDHHCPKDSLSKPDTTSKS